MRRTLRGRENGGGSAMTECNIVADRPHASDGLRGTTFKWKCLTHGSIKAWRDNNPDRPKRCEVAVLLERGSRIEQELVNAKHEIERLKKRIEVLDGVRMLAQEVADKVLPKAGDIPFSTRECLLRLQQVLDHVDAQKETDGS